MSDVIPDYQPTHEDIRILREWLKKMPHLLQDYDDALLSSFVQSRKGSLERTKAVLEKFNSLGILYPEFFGHLDIYDRITQKCLKDIILFPLPKQLENGSYIYVLSSDHHDTESKKLHLIELWRYWTMIYYVLAWEHTSYEKVVVIFDWKNLSLGHFKEITPDLIAKMIGSLKDMPVRTKAVFNINVPPLLEWILTMIKSVISKKLADRFHFISSMDTLYEHVPRKILPKDFGGNEDDVKTMHRRWMKKVEGYRDRLVEENLKMRRLDHLRPKSTDPQNMVGTFKVLNID